VLEFDKKILDIPCTAEDGQGSNFILLRYVLVL
jgi:hypothetical protein